ncbi:hypothetical protein Rleg10DRAFT_5640 [Rhizobium leguminosarum bv. trifolii WSM2012]|nr:hypothetical protein Rleg10DRAFT_4346 [Rhizobium leguminosarum bv. trifolii WSM2012]EJC76948.1 hypothetical protein Rleg10DRAFT_5640 [Rhizobium leguminosarum bv. trifolii WSM2012]
MPRTKASVHLQILAKKRSDDAISAIYEVKARLTREYHSGRLSSDDILRLTLASLCESAGLNWNFLNGPKYKGTLKPEIKEFLKTLKAAQKTSMPVSSERKPGCARLEESNARLRDMLHQCRLLLNEKRSVIKSISAQVSPKVVRFPPENIS